MGRERADSDWDASHVTGQTAKERQLPNDRMLWKGTALMRFASFPTINSVLSNSAELRRQSRHVFGVPMENRTAMKTRDGAS
jgi:hypothetical protein